MEHMLSIKISPEDYSNMTPKENDDYLEMILDSMSPEQKERLQSVSQYCFSDDQLNDEEKAVISTIMMRNVGFTINEGD